MNIRCNTAAMAWAGTTKKHHRQKWPEA